MTCRKRPGQAMVEFALCAPIMLALMLGIIDLGWLYNHQLMLTHATREGARLGALGQNAGQIRSAIKDHLGSAGFTPVPTDSQIQVDLSGGKAHVAVAVAVPALFAISGPAITLGATTDMRLE